jgi:hypothetical protein
MISKLVGTGGSSVRDLPPNHQRSFHTTFTATGHDPVKTATTTQFCGRVSRPSLPQKPTLSVIAPYSRDETTWNPSVKRDLLTLHPSPFTPPTHSTGLTPITKGFQSGELG